jgi:hypothetical protein
MRLALDEVVCSRLGFFDEMMNQSHFFFFLILGLITIVEFLACNCQVFFVSNKFC